MTDDLPDFVNDTLVSKIWKQTLQDDDLVQKECTITRVGAKGDNYSSVMCRAVSTIETKGKTITKKVVLKTLPTGAAAVKYVKRTMAFEKEQRMLAEVMPAIEKLLSTETEKVLAAKLYYSETSPNVILAMEDLSEGNFTVADRFKGLDTEHCVKVLENLAAYHAATMILLKQKPELEEFFDGCIWGPSNRENLDIGLVSALETIIQNIDSWSEAKWAEKLGSVFKQVPGKIYEYTGFKNPKRPMVLNHGDLWLNNIMFKSDPLDLRFVDLQLSWVNSPVFDLMYFFFTSPTTDVRKNKLEFILQTYYNNLTKQCANLGIDLNYSFDDLLEDWKDNLFFGFTMFYFVYPIISAPSKDAIDTSVEGADVMKENPIFTNKNFQDNFLALLPYFDEQGLFENK